MGNQNIPDPDDLVNDETSEEEENEIHLRDTAEYIQAIGPEEEDRDVIEEGLENYGFDQLSEDNFESQVTASSDNPDWMTERALERADADFPHNENPDGMYDNDEDDL